ncbi:MAG: membrane protein insertase YidC [Planctomycetes bacterium]|nr:membrane protein insertase YidC [Planctomycetota bacterium]
MDKRLLIVLPLCLVILLGWQMFSDMMGWTVKPPPPPVATQPVDESGQPLAPAPAAAPSGAAPKSAEKPLVSTVVADTEVRRDLVEVGTRGTPGYYRAWFSNRGGVLEELRTGNYFDRAQLTEAEQADHEHWTQLVALLPSGDAAPRSFSFRTSASSAEYTTEPLDTALWTAKKIERGIEYRLSPGQGLTFVKRYRFHEASDQLRFEIEITNDARPDATGFKSFFLTPAVGIPRDTGDAYYPEPQAVAFSRARDGDSASPIIALVDPSGDKRGDTLAVGSPLSFAGVFNKYFAVVLRAADQESKPTLLGASWRAVAHDKSNGPPHQLVTDIDVQLVIPAVGATRTWSYDLYAGPKEREAFDAAYADHAVIFDHDLGYMRSLAKLLMWVLSGFHSLTASWGMAIILLTIMVRVILFPINRRAQTAMGRYQAKIKRVQPKIDEIKKRYADDPTKLRAEQARIMQEADALVPPLGGCLPPLLQIPVFFGLLSAIRVPFELRQAPFMGWISDLSLPDRLMPLDWNLPWPIGHVPYLNILPPLMVVMWILQQRSMPKPTDEQAKMMYKMMMFMPIIMGVFLYNYAAGLSLYMITTSTLGIIEQKVIKKYWPIDETPPPKKKSGFMAKLMAQAQEQQKQRENAQRKKSAARR